MLEVPDFRKEGEKQSREKPLRCCCTELNRCSPEPGILGFERLGSKFLTHTVPFSILN